MTADERRDFMHAMAEDRRTVATEATGIDLRSYQRLVSAVCDVLVGPTALARTVVAITQRGAVSIAVDLIGYPHPCETYSAEPKLATDAPGLFENLDQWLDDQVPSRTRVPRCPIAGHTDRWTLALADDNPWRICRGDGGLIDQFQF
jgi:hypothetical protein